jgi:hypothetical protein
MMMGQQRRVVKMRTLGRGGALTRFRGRKNAFMQSAGLINVPRVTTQSTLPGLLSYTDHVYYNTLIDSFRDNHDTRPVPDLHIQKA